MAIIAESEVLEAIAQYDFTARSSREVSHDDDDDTDDDDLGLGELHERRQHRPLQPGQLRLVERLRGRQRGSHPRQIRPHQDQVIPAS